MDDTHVPEDKRCSCTGCRVRNGDSRAGTVFWFTLAAVLVASVWGGLRIGMGSGVSALAVLVTILGILIAATWLHLLMGWRKPCASKSERDNFRRELREQEWRAWLEAGEVTDEEFDEQVELGFPDYKSDLPEEYNFCLPLALILGAILLGAIVAVVTWLISSLL